MSKFGKQTAPKGRSPDFSCTGKTTGLDGRFAGGKAYGCHQFLNWWPQDATGILHLDGFESRSLHQNKEIRTSSLWGMGSGFLFLLGTLHIDTCVL